MPEYPVISDPIRQESGARFGINDTVIEGDDFALHGTKVICVRNQPILVQQAYTSNFMNPVVFHGVQVVGAYGYQPAILRCNDARIATAQPARDSQWYWAQRVLMNQYRKSSDKPMVFDIRGELQGGRNRRTDGFLRGSQDLPHHHRSSDDLGGHGPRLRHDGESLREGMQPSVEYGGDEIMR